MSDFQKVISRLLQGNKLKQPFIYDPLATSYREDLKVRLDSFIDRLSKFEDQGEVEKYFHNNLNDMRGLCNNILSIIDRYLSGSAGQAYYGVEDLLSMPVVQRSIRYLIHDMSKFTSNVNSLYRVRKTESPITDRKDIFHIPFQLRNLVATQRYSIAGLPSLYLGTSIYVCWQEMGKPDLNTLYLSRYLMSSVEKAREVNVLNFAYSLETLKEQEFESMARWGKEYTELDIHIAYIVFFPILLACSYNRAHENASFHPEYILPNLLLQWISKEKSSVSGISYYSTKTKQLRHHHIGVNFVFPPETDNVVERGFCPLLSERFHLTKPVSWQLLDAINGFETIQKASFVGTNDLEEEFVKSYQNTKFSEMELKLEKVMQLDKVGA